MSAAVCSVPSALDAKAAWRSLRRSASAPYRDAGRFAWHFASGKLGADPVFRHILVEGLIAPHSRVLDIGCGAGLLGSLLVAAGQAEREGMWPANWPAAPAAVRLTGIELRPRDAARARAALGDHAEVICGDMCSTPFPASDVVVILDVLHYVGIAEQDAVLARVRQSLRPGGRLLLRVGDASQRGFRRSRWVDRLVVLLRGQGHLRLVGRPLAAWQQQLAALGFAVEVQPMSQGTPFANVLLLARVPDDTSYDSLASRRRAGEGAREAPKCHAEPPPRPSPGGGGSARP